MGIDIEKPLKTSPLVPENGMLEYCLCRYIVLGEPHNKLIKKIGNVELEISTSYPSISIQREFFVINIYPIKLNGIM